MSGTVSESRKAIKVNDRRIATIDGVMSAYKTYKELKPVFDEYQKKGFKISKDMFYNKHKDEIDSFNKALRYLKKNVDPEPEDVRKFMDEKVGKMSVKMALREEIAKVAREDIIKERNHIKSRGKEESF